MHKSVLLNECIEYLILRDDSIIVDCTLGYGGHSSEILKRIPKGHLYAFDQDKDAIKASQTRLSEISDNYTIINSNFKNIKEQLLGLNINQVNGILYDLGVSSPQLDVAERGFSFHNDAPLDMRMNQDQELSALNVVNEYEYKDLVNILTKYGEEKYATIIARAIINNRPLKTTMELVEVIQNNVPAKYRREKHPARKTFQAIRIEVNDELNVFENSLRNAITLLAPQGRLCVITFHSLEDKICKSIFKEVTSLPEELKNMPVVPEAYLPNYKIVKVIEPSKEELENNPRSRSAKLRIIERIK